MLYIAVRGDFILVGDLMKSVSLLQCGVDHYQAWTLAGRNISGRKGLYGTVSKRQTFACRCWIGNEEAGNIAGVLGARFGTSIHVARVVNSRFGSENSCMDRIRSVFLQTLR